jgi:YVTN family beta-propeller protein
MDSDLGRTMKKILFAFIFCFLSLTTASAQDAPPSQTATNQPPPIEVENWTKPHPGWLYVLDVRPNVGETGGHIWLVDPETGKLMGSIRTGYHPDFALSPDGTRLYIASDTHVRATVLAVVDTTTGEALGGEPVQRRAEPELLPPFSTMAISGDGKSLRILVQKPDSEEFQLDTIAADSGVLLPGHVNVKNCGDGQFVSFPTADHVDFVCPTMKKVRMVRTDDKSKELDNTSGLFPWNHKLGVGAAFPAPGGKFITIVRGDGAIFQMDVVTLSFYPTSVHAGSPGQVSPSGWPRSPDGSKVYLGYSHTAAANAIAREIRVYDTATWHRLATMKTSIPFWSATLDTENNRLYAVAPEQHSILVIDAQTLHEIRTITVGAMPALAIVAP